MAQGPCQSSLYRSSFSIHAARDIEIKNNLTVTRERWEEIMAGGGKGFQEQLQRTHGQSQGTG